MLTPISSLPSVIIIDILSSLPSEVYLVIFLLVVLLIGSYMLPSWFGRGSSRLGARERQHLSTISFEPRLVMSPGEALVYNALHMVVRDRFLLLAKVPVRNLVQMNETDMAARRAFIHSTRNIIVDFVLLHPGSLITEKVLFWESNPHESQSSRFPGEVVLDILHRAQIGVVCLSAEKSYTVEELTAILGLGEED